MELRHVRYFIAVAEEKSFTRAAQKLRIAQPPLSRQIRDLEEELGVTLLERTSRTIRITAAGRVLLAEGRQLLAQAAEAVDRTRRAGSLSPQSVRVGFATGLGDAVQAALMRHLAAHPEAEVQFRNILSSEQAAALTEREIDIGLLRPPVDRNVFNCETLYRERLMALLPKGHILAREHSIALRQLAHETILLHKRSASAGLYDKVLELLREAEIQPKLVQTRTGPYEEAGTVLVASGKGIYIGGGAAIAHPGVSRQVRAVPISDSNATIGICMAWRKEEQSPQVLEFVESMRRALGRRSDEKTPRRKIIVRKKS
jgi:LysR family transcriptional regulator, hca operon transcriptional activator